MDVRIDVLTWNGRPARWSHGALIGLPSSLADAASAVEAHLGSTDSDYLLFWDADRDLPDSQVLADLVSSRVDAWHSGLCFGLAGEPEEHDYIHPTWPLALDCDLDDEGVSWRVSLHALLVKTEVLRAVGGLDPAFRQTLGAGLELGRRMIDNGAIIFHTPRLIGGARIASQPFDEHDRFVFLRRLFGRKWVRYAAARRVMSHGHPIRVANAMKRSGKSCASIPRPVGTGETVTRGRVEIEPDPAVTVVLPTLGRYQLLRPLLEQLRQQTVTPAQVIIVDQNDAELRDHSLYEEFADLGLEVIFQVERGQWLARNAAVSASKGEWIAFLDDDSEIYPDFIEQHLEGLARYDADLSTGASNAVVGAPIPANYAFFRVADQWDSGNGMCHRSLFDEFGLFDQQFDRQRRGDAEFGLRVQIGGRLVIHNPHAIRIHLKAAEGGLRTFGSWDGFRHRDRTSPLPLPSVIYYSRRYHTDRQVREDLMLGLIQSIVPYELKRRASARQWLGFVAAEMLRLPSTTRRVRRSLALADEMIVAGPKIPSI